MGKKIAGQPGKTLKNVQSKNGTVKRWTNTHTGQTYNAPQTTPAAKPLPASELPPPHTTKPAPGGNTLYAADPSQIAKWQQKMQEKKDGNASAKATVVPADVQWREKVTSEVYAFTAAFEDYKDDTGLANHSIMGELNDAVEDLESTMSLYEEGLVYHSALAERLQEVERIRFETLDGSNNPFAEKMEESLAAAIADAEQAEW